MYAPSLKLNHQTNQDSIIQELTRALAQANRELTLARKEVERYRAMLDNDVMERKLAGEVLVKPDASFLTETDTDITGADWRGANTQATDARSRLGSVALLDELTRLHNRHAFHDRLELELPRAKQYEMHLSLIMLDLDHFKDYNNAFGHDAGDAVLQTVARLLQQNARDVDFVARYGGDEFVVIAPAGLPGKSLIIAERLRAAFERTTWPNRQITASFGVTSFESETMSPCRETLISEAIEALVLSKESGRNRATHAHSN